MDLQEQCEINGSGKKHDHVILAAFVEPIIS
jgi:hypothetical protein